MAESNDFNLVISDEESVNAFTGRSHNTLSQHGSPGAAQFIRRGPSGNIQTDTMQQRRIASPMPVENQMQYDQGYDQEYDQGHDDPHGGYYPNEEYLTPSNLGNTYSPQDAFNTDSSKKAQFIKKAKRHSHDGSMSGDNANKRMQYEAEAAGGQEEDGANHYVNPQRGFGLFSQRLVKTATEGFEGSYGDDGDDGSQEIAEEEERRAQSLRDSQLSGPVRYSKMSEEEAARAFENRKKELLNTFSKKGPKKSSGGPGRPAENEPKGGRREVQPQDDQQGKAMGGFVIFNNKNNETPNQPPGKMQGKGSEKNLQAKRTPSNERRDSPVNAAPSAKQRKDSPSQKNISRSNSQKQTPKSQKTPQNVNEPKRVTPRNMPDYKQDPLSKVSIELKKGTLKNKNEEQQYVEYQQRNVQEMNQRYEPQQDRGRGVIRAQPVEQEMENNGAYYVDAIKSKNQDILADIQNIDEEIYRLESENSRRVMPNERDNEEVNQAVNKGGSSYQNQYRQRMVNGTEAQRPSQQEKENYPAQGYARGNQRQDPYQRGNTPDKKQGRGHPMSPNAADEREKRQRINQLKAEKGQRDTGTSHDSLKDQMYQSYMVLNEKGFEHHYDYLYERALVQKKSREFVQERSKELRERDELIHCTFSPVIKEVPTARRDDIITKTKNWQIEKEKQSQLNEKSKIEKELRDCTFYPNGIIEKDERLYFNSNDFYKRNIEWTKRKDAEGMRKQNELYKNMMTAPERPKTHMSMSISRIHDSHIFQENKSPGPTNTSGLVRNNSNKSLRSTSKAERSSSKKRNEPQKERTSYKKVNQSISARGDKPKPQQIDRPVKTRESVNNNKGTPKEINTLNLQSQIMESYAILDGLQNILSAKEKAKQEKIVHVKQNVDKKLKTLTSIQQQQQQSTNNSKMIGRVSYNPNRATLSPNRSQTHLAGKSPLRPATQDIKTTEGTTQHIVVRNNRYFIEEKPNDKPIERPNERPNSRANSRLDSRTNSRPHSRPSKERSRSIDSRKRIPTDDYKSSGMAQGSYVAAASQAKKRKESPFKPKGLQKNFETSVSKTSYSELRGSPFTSLVVSPQSQGFFGMGQSPRQELNYVSKGLTSPNTQNLEKKYLDLLSQVSRVTKQLDTVNSVNNALQDDIRTFQKRQMTNSLLYS